MTADIFGVIAPHPPIMVEAVGGTRAAVTADSIAALHEAAALLAAFDPDTVVVMSPHAPALADAFVIDTAARFAGSLAAFGAPRAVFACPGDTELAHALLAALAETGVSALDRASVPALDSGELDHGVLVPMSFLDPDGRRPLVVLSLSYLPYADHRTLGRQVAATASALGRRIAFVASGDCSHRLTRDAPAGYSPRGAEFDRALAERISASDFEALSQLDPALVEAAGECGLRSFITLGSAAAPARARVLAYEGPWGVGYLTAVVNESLAVSATPSSGRKGGAAGTQEHEIVRLARDAIEAYIRSGEVLQPAPLADPDLPERAGAFVTLHRAGSLRGCIGTILPAEDSLAQEIVRNAIQASTADPRFPRLEPSELQDLDLKVDVLRAPEACGIGDLDPRMYGVIVSCGWKRGLLLPDLEGVDTVEDQVDIACRKGGIGPDDVVELERFRVDRYA